MLTQPAHDANKIGLKTQLSAYFLMLITHWSDAGAQRRLSLLRKPQSLWGLGGEAAI
jgi:hypothetical protein